MAATATLQARLAEAEQARHDLLVGAKEVQVGFDGKTTTYDRTSLGKLDSYIVELKTALGQTVTPRRALGIRA